MEPMVAFAVLRRLGPRFDHIALAAPMATPMHSSSGETLRPPRSAVGVWL